MQLVNHWRQVQNFLATCPATNLVERQEAYDNYLAAVTQFELDFQSEPESANTAHCRGETDTAGAGVRFQPPTGQSTRPAAQQRIFQNSSLPVQNDLLDPGLVDANEQNPTLFDIPPVDDDTVNYSDNESRVQGYDPPLHEPQFEDDWYNPNQNGYYQPMQTYPSSDPVMQHAFDQERYAARLASYNQSLAELNAKLAEESVGRAMWENQWLHQIIIQQQSTVPNQSQFNVPAEASMLNADEVLARQLATQEAVSAEQPVLPQSAMTVPAADLPAGTYSIYCPLPDPATVT